MVDLVNHPPHYCKAKGGVEAIDYIKQQLGKDFPAYLEGSAIKYIHRHKYKEANIQDLEKAVWYINRLIQHYENL
jgi:CRISPR/Cas system-associated protein Cas5 (RAMP superfamily)